MNIRPSGVIAPLVTPVDLGGDVSAEGMRRQVDAIRSQISGLMPCISSGEGWRLSSAQWLAAIEATMSSACGLAVYAGCQAVEWAELERRSLRAQELGADAVVLSLPCDHGMASNGAILARFARIRDLVNIPIVFYWESFISGRALDPDVGMRLCEELGAVAVKDSMRDRALTRLLIDRFAGGMSILQGWEDLLTPDLLVDGYVGPLALVSPVTATVFKDEPRWAAIPEEAGRFGTLGRDYISRVKTELHRRGVLPTAREFPGVRGVAWDG